MSLRPLKTCRALLLLSLFIIPTQGNSQEAWTHFGVRPLAMGNAFVSVADDFNALYYNPAGLARLKDWSLEIINPKFDVSSNTYFLYKRLDLKKSMTTSETLQRVKEESGRPNHVGFALSPYFVKRNWGFGLTVDTAVSFIPHRNAAVDTGAAAQVTVPISIAGNFFDEQLSLGITLKGRAIANFDEQISMDNIDLISKNDNRESQQKLKDFLKSGRGFGADLGLLYTPNDITTEPTLGLSIIDIGGTRLSKLLKDGEKATNYPPIFNLGLSLKPVKTERNYVLVAVDAQDMNSSQHFSHKLVYGLEWGFMQWVKVGVGLFNGYPTAGLQLDFSVIKIRLATYAVDRSPLIGLEKNLADRRVTIQIKVLI